MPEDGGHSRWDMEKSRLGFADILWFIYGWALELATVKYCRRECGMDGKTFVQWCQKMRTMCQDALLKQTTAPIGGWLKIVEIDESLFSKRKANKGRQLPETL